MAELRVNRPTWAEIDLDALAFNYHSIRDFVDPAVEVMAVVKADAYGHGAVRCSRRLAAEGVTWFAVATVEEALELRDSGIEQRILVLGGFWPGQESTLIDHALTPIIFRLDQAKSLASEAVRRGTTANVHVKLDTGMNRIGFRPEEFESTAEELAADSGLEVEGLMTHFAAADDGDEGEFTAEQIALFERGVETFKAHGILPKYTGLANTPGTIAHPQAHAGMVRVGGMLYGLGTEEVSRSFPAPELRPVMSVRTKVAMVKTVTAGETVGYGRTFRAERDTVIATVPIGYHDGFSRSHSNTGKMIIHGRPAPIAGRVSMDWTTLDVTDIQNVEPGDVVTVLGSDGENTITAEELANNIGTISYEITCSLGPRVPRIYLSAEYI